MIEFRGFQTSDLGGLNLQEFQKSIDDLINDEEYGEKCMLSEMAFTGFLDGKVVGSAGILKTDDHVGQCWMVLGDDIPLRGWVEIAQKNREIIKVAHSLGMWRLWCTVLLGFYAGERYAQRLGFECEGVMRHYDRDGNHHALYAKIDFGDLHHG